MRQFRATVVVASLAIGAARAVLAQDDPGRREFLAWAATALHPLTAVAPAAARADLAALRTMIGRASVVALSEGAHAGAEPLEFRNRVFEYLVEELGFTAIAIESGITESQVVHDYVRGGSGDRKTVMAQGFGWTFDRFPQNAALVSWMRAYNAHPDHRRKINFYGFDVPGSPGNPGAIRGLGTALDEVLRYLDRVDGAAAADLHRRVDSHRGMIRFDPRPNAGPQYAQLSETERNQLTAVVADIISLLERREARYTAASSDAAYRWAYRNAIAARQADGWLRRTPGGASPTGPGAEREWRSQAGDLRDRAMADNFQWIIEQEGPEAKVLVFVARNHLSMVPMDRGSAPGSSPLAAMGTYLKQRFGDRLVTIGNLVGGGAVGCEDLQMPLPAASSPSVAALVARRDTPSLFLLDLRRAPRPVATWLGGRNDLWDGLGPLTPRGGRPFDVVFFTRTLTPACPR